MSREKMLHFHEGVNNGDSDRERWKELDALYAQAVAFNSYRHLPAIVVFFFCILRFSTAIPYGM